MFVAIANTPRDYAWGSLTAMAELLGHAPTGQPQAELWLGAHPGSPSRILDPTAVGGATNLATWIASRPTEALGELSRLPFLMKVLAAGAPLSLQAHPSLAQAIEGFERENALGIALDAPNRNYKDPFPKPEVIYALSDSFDALCGFRPAREAREVFHAVGLDELVPRLDSLAELFAWLMSGEPDVDALTARTVAHVAAQTAVSGSNAPVHSSVVTQAFDTVTLLAQHYPGDVGIVAALLLNRVAMTRGQALYLDAGNIHMYLKGVGVEIMTASDNVLRGGLTPKHVDVTELVRVLDFAQGPPPRLEPDVISSTLEVFRPHNDDFVLVRATGVGSLPLTGPVIALCTAGTMTITGQHSSITLSRGDAAFGTASETDLSISGAGELFLGTTP